MRLSLERTSIVGMNNSWICLDKEQKELLETVSTGIKEHNLKNVVLWGGHGTGKTVLGVEVAKMFMATFRNENMEYNLHVVDCELKVNYM